MARCYARDMQKRGVSVQAISRVDLKDELAVTVKEEIWESVKKEWIYEQSMG